jgi:hypothetical protein
MDVDKGEWDAFWIKYLDKYENLMYMIAHRISGDRATASVEDNFADLFIEATKSVKGFMALTGIPFNKLLEEKNFDKYTKTALWNGKNRKGKYITERRSILDDQYSLDYDYNVSGEGNTYSIYTAIAAFCPELENLDYLDFLNILTEFEQEVFQTVVRNPSVISVSGKLKIRSLGKILKTKVTTYKIERALESIKRKLIQSGFSDSLLESEE